MTAHIFGVGLGLFIIVALWISAGLIFLISLRIQKRIGAIALIVAFLITIILICIPRSPQQQIIQVNKPYDKFFICRLILVTVLACSTCIAVIGLIKFRLADLARPQRIKDWVY